MTIKLNIKSPRLISQDEEEECQTLKKNMKNIKTFSEKFQIANFCHFLTPVLLMNLHLVIKYMTAAPFTLTMRK